MTDQNTSAVLGTSTVSSVLGVAILPNTGEGSLANILAFTLITCGGVVLLSLAVAKIIRIKTKK